MGLRCFIKRSSGKAHRKRTVLAWCTIRKSFRENPLDRWECGGRYEDFYEVQSFDVEVIILFSVGQIDGYFDYEPPKEFWEILAVYVSHSSLCLIIWAEKFGEEEINEMKRRSKMTFEDYENFQSIIPHWYKDNFIKYKK